MSINLKRQKLEDSESLNLLAFCTNYFMRLNYNFIIKDAPQRIGFPF